MDPLLSIQIYNQPAVYRPGDAMRCDYQIDAIASQELKAVEASLVWVTEGKGDEDMGLHFFERRTPSDAIDGDLRPLHTFTSKLPNSPLSYQGELLHVRWYVRIRVFMKSSKEHILEKLFVLTNEITPTSVNLLPHE